MGVEGGGMKPPSSVQTGGADIVQKMFQENQGKPMDAQQQAQQLQQQTATQEQNRSTVREEAQQEAHQPERQSESSRAPDRSEGPLVRETDMDKFLARTSDQQMQRDAGRQLSKPQQTVGSANAQNWTVANSPNTPESARSMLRQQAQQGQLASRSPNPQAQASGRTTTTANPAMARTMPAMPRTPAGGTERGPAVVIQYGRAFGSGTDPSTRTFTGRPFSPDSMFQQVQRLVQNQLGGAAQQFANTTAQVAVNIRGNIVFVKDGKEFRAFKLNKDGSLTELPSEDGGEHPLSSEAQALLGKALRQRAVGIRKGDGSLRGSDQAETGKTEGTTKEGQAADKGEAGKEPQLDFETRFALLLHQVLEEGHEVYQAVGEGGPQFPGKSDWEAFFARMMKMGNQEKGTKKSMEDVLGMIFRGLFKKGGQTNTLVGDLKYSAGDKTKEQKFTQVVVDDEEFLEMLSNLKPGQNIDSKLMKKMFGEEISYLELDHILEQQSRLIQAEESGKNVIYNPKGNIDAFSQARLERSIFGAKKNGARLEADAGMGAPPMPPDPGPQTVPANIFELLGMKEAYRGKPRLYTFILYAIFVSVIGIAVTSLFLK